MEVMSMKDTIAAISTALGIGGIAIIRVSGDEAIKIVNRIFKGPNLNKVGTHTISYGHIYNNDDNSIVDEVLVTVMRKPKTFTKEDIVEINCHGGIGVTNKILQLVFKNGARLAEPGEFTKRAFLNGRIDLLKAEAVIDLINAKTEASRKLAINQLAGKVSKLIKELRTEILNLMANIEVNIDYPEYEDIPEVAYEELNKKIVEIKNKMGKILYESENGKIIKEGIKVIIVGKPNVGKSSILNKLLDEEKAIVTDIPGTTRDVIEGTINLDGILLNIMDTAGIRKTADVIEKIGVEKSKKLISEADLIILVLNNNEEISDEDMDIINEIKNKTHIVMINKIDLESKIDRNKIDSHNIVVGDTVTDNGLDQLKAKIKELFRLEEITHQDPTYLSNARQITILEEAINLTCDIEKSIIEKVPIDIIEIDIRKIWQLLGEIIGETYKDEIIDQIFVQFCVGK
jgi:tRNA modification GTPase